MHEAVALWWAPTTALNGVSAFAVTRSILALLSFFCFNKLHQEGWHFDAASSNKTGSQPWIMECMEDSRGFS
jgi:hypothetical protein